MDAQARAHGDQLVSSDLEAYAELQQDLCQHSRELKELAGVSLHDPASVDACAS